MIHLMRRKRRVADGRSIPNRAAVFLTRSCDWARWRYFWASRGRHRAGRRARLASRVGDAPRAYLRRARDDASRVAERGARRRAPRVDPRGGVLQLVAIRRVRRHERRGSRRRVPVRGRGAERRVPRLVRPGTSHPPLPPHHLPRVPLPTPRERHRDVRAVTFRAPSSLYSFPVERRRGGATTRRARDRPRPFVPVPSPPSLPTRPSPREHAPPPPRTSPHPGGDWIPPPRDAVFLAPEASVRRRVHLFRRRLRVHHRRVRRVPRRRASMVAARGGRPRGGTRRARRRVQPVEHARGSRRRRRGERQVGETRRERLEGSCTVCTC